MKQTAAILVVTSVVLMAFVGFQPSTAENPGAEVIGEYYQLGTSDDLTTNHVDWVDDVMEIAAPPLTNNLKVETGFLQQEMGDWASLEAFSVGEGVVEFESQQASFVNLSLGSEPVFTWGSTSQIEFLERPMWISAEQEEHGGRITLTMEDGNTDGQQIYISKDWLWERGIHRPNATHEDGAVLPVNQTEDQKGFIIDVHHFSTVEIDPEGLDVKGRQNGVIFPHLGEVRWYPEDELLEVDVGQQLNAYELLIEYDWVGMNLTFPALLQREWTVEEIDGLSYYVIDIPSEDTPVTVEMMNFTADNQWVYTSGSPYTFYLFDKPKFLSIDYPLVGGVEIDVGLGDSMPGNLTGNIGVNGGFAASLGIDSPNVTGPNGNVRSLGVSGGMFQFLLEEGVYTITQGESFDLDLDEDECLNTEKTLYKWDGDSGHPGSLATLYRIESGVFCFEWYMESTASSGIWSSGPAFYLAHMSVWDSSDVNIQCEFGNSGEGGGGEEDQLFQQHLVNAGVELEGQSGAAECIWPEAETGEAIMARFHGHAVSHTPHEHRYSGQKKLSNCLTGSEAPVGLPIIIAKLIASAIAYYIIHCADDWADWGLSKAFDNDPADRENEAIITRESVTINHYINVYITDTNERRADTWGVVESYPVCLRTHDWKGGQSVYWQVNNVLNSWVEYKSDFSLIRGMPTGQNGGSDYELADGWQYSSGFKADARDGVDDINAVFEVVLDWEAEPGLGMEPPSPMIDFTINPQLPGTPEFPEFHMIKEDSNGGSGGDPPFYVVLTDEGDSGWVENGEVIDYEVTFTPQDVEDTFLNHYGGNQTDPWAFIRTFLKLITTNETYTNAESFELEPAEDPLEFFNLTGLLMGDNVGEYEYESLFSVESKGMSTFNPGQSVEDSDFRWFLIFFEWLPIIKEQVC